MKKLTLAQMEALLAAAAFRKAQLGREGRDVDPALQKAVDKLVHGINAERETRRSDRVTASRA